MLSRFLVNLLLLLIIIVLLALLLQNDDSDITSNITLTNLQADAVDTINIRHRERLIQIEKHDKKWRITRPVVVAANDFRVGTLLKLLDTKSHSRYLAASLDLGKFGLEQPGTVISFNNTEIAFGIVNPINNYRYVKTGNSVHLVDDLYYPLLSSQLGTLVSLNMLDNDSHIIKLELPDETVLSRDNNGNWQSNTELLTDDIVETVTNWQNLQAFAVHDYMQRNALGRVNVYLEGVDTPITFTITDIDPWLILARPELGIEYHFNLDAYDALLRPGVEKEQSPDTGGEQSLQVPADEFLQNLSQ